MKKLNWTVTETEGYDSDGNARIERRQRKMREIQRASLIEAVGRRQQYLQLAIPFRVAAAELCNHLPESGAKTPMERIGGEVKSIEEHFHPPGSKCIIWESKRRQGKEDATARVGIYIKPSRKIRGGVTCATAEYDEKKEMWEIGPTMDRLSVDVLDGEMLLTTKPAGKEIGAIEMEKGIDKISGTLPGVWVLNKIVGKRNKNGEVQYKINWKGYASHEDTWEPEGNLVDFGATEEMKKYERMTKRKSIKLTKLEKLPVKDSETLAVEYLMRKHNLGGTVEQHTEAYKNEYDAMINRWEKMRILPKAEAKEIIRKAKEEGEKMAWLRMNPEWHKPDHDNPNGRSKMRWIVIGCGAPGHWAKEDTGAPTLLPSTIRQVVAMGSTMSCENIEEDEIATGDIAVAFLQGYDYSIAKTNDEPFYAAYREHPGAEVTVVQLQGPVYGQEDAAVNLHNTFNDWITGKTHGYVRYRPEEVEAGGEQKISEEKQREIPKRKHTKNEIQSMCKRSSTVHSPRNRAHSCKMGR